MGKDRQSTPTRWIPGAKLMKICNIENVDLKDWVLNYGLNAYDPFTLEPLNKVDLEDGIPMDGATLDYTSLERLEDSFFRLDELLRFAKKHGLHQCLHQLENEYPELSSIEEATKSAEQEKSFPCEPGTPWKDITMTLIANDTLRIKTPQSEGRFTYHELKMSDKRRGDKPTMLWELLKLFAKNQGFISSQNPNYDPKLPDTAKRLNKHLKELFGIKDSIYQEHYKKEKGYRTRIKFSDVRHSTNNIKLTKEDESLQNVKDIFREADVYVKQSGASQRKRYQQD